MSPRGTSRTRPSAPPPLPRSGRPIPWVTKGPVDTPRSPGSPSRPPEKNSGREGIRYRAAPTARLRGDVVTFRWEMLLAESETVLASGLEFLIVDDDGRILVDHPFAAA